jgi:hypothetical protein
MSPGPRNGIGDVDLRWRISSRALIDQQSWTSDPRHGTSDTFHDHSRYEPVQGPGRTGRNTDLEPNRVNTSRRLEDTHSESPEARPEVRTRPRVCDSQGLA